MLGYVSAEKTSERGETRIRFYMSNKNKDYIFYLYNILKDYVKTPPKELIRSKNNLELEHISSSSPEKNNVSTRTDIWFSTLKLPVFNWVFNDFYIKKNNKNIKI
jgi:hypothetical protein